MPKPLTPPVQAIIRAGDMLSDVVNLSEGSVAFVVGPAEWTEAEISFRVSYDGADWFDLFDSDGYEVTRVVITPFGAVRIDPALTEALQYLQIRSGSRVQPVEQEMDRVFTLILQA